MDPDELWRNLRESMGAIPTRTKAQNAEMVDYASAFEHATNLLAWLDKGGFAPKGFNREVIASYCRSVISRTRPYAKP